MYRLKSNFDGTWDIETEVENTLYYNDISKIDDNGYHPTRKEIVKEWRVMPHDSGISYSKAKLLVEHRIAKAAFKPTFLTPPLPNRDPLSRKRFLGIF